METPLIAKIREAFAARDYPGDDHLVVDTTGMDLEQAEIAAAFRGKRWDEIPVPTLEYNYSALSFFTEAAFQYYLPAFMIGHLTAGDKIEQASAWLIYALSPPSVSFHAAMLDFPQDIIDQLPPEARDLLRNAQEGFKALTEAEGGAELVQQRQQSLFDAKMAGFTPQERAAIVDFLTYAAEHGDSDAQKALAGYWKRSKE